MLRKALLTTFMWVGFFFLAAPAFAQGGWSGLTDGASVYQWALIAGAGGLAVAAAAGAYSQSRVVSSACEGIARNPSAAPQIRFALLLGLVLIESLVIYVFVISLVIMFVNWGTLGGA